MTIAALITEGIGPGGSIEYLLTEGLDIGSGALPMSATMTGVGSITANLTAPTMAASMSASGTLTGTVAPPPLPNVIPHDDYWDDDRRPWWHRQADSSLEARIERSRIEIGLKPSPSAAKDLVVAERAVEKAVAAIVKAPSALAVEAKAFDLVSAYERNYRNAIRRILGKARAEDTKQAFRDEVKKALAERDRTEREEKRRRIVRDDDEFLLSLSTWL